MIAEAICDAFLYAAAIAVVVAALFISDRVNISVFDEKYHDFLFGFLAGQIVMAILFLRNSTRG